MNKEKAVAQKNVCAAFIQFSKDGKPWKNNKPPFAYAYAILQGFEILITPLMKLTQLTFS